MKELVRDAVKGRLDSLVLLTKEGRKSVAELLEVLKSLSDEELFALGSAYRSFPVGCDLTEILVDVVSPKISYDEIRGGFRLVSRLGFPLHMCSYAVADVAEKLGKTPLELAKQLRQLADVPIDVDHFGIYGPMRYPEEIVKCPADCYRSGKPFNGCPRGRIHKRLLEKEKKYADEKKGWAEVAQSISVSLMSAQKPTSHAADIAETESVISFARSNGLGVGSIICVGNAQDELVKGIEATLRYKIDEVVIEGGPYNTARNRPRAFAEAVVLARITSFGKVVATNGQYEDELIYGLKSGLNGVISGFPGNHHAYMSGYKPKEATVNKFGLPKVLELMVRHIESSSLPVPADRQTALLIAKSAKFSRDFLYPKKLWEIPVGDAHWLLLSNSPLAQKLKLKMTPESLLDEIKRKKVKKLALLGARFVAWAVAMIVSKEVEEFVISDPDQTVESRTAEVFTKAGFKVLRAYGDDEVAVNSSDAAVLCSFMPTLLKKFSSASNVILLD